MRGVLLRLVVLGALAALAPVTPGGGAAAAGAASYRTIRVPRDVKTVQRAVDRARPGDLVLVSPGVYKEAVTVGTDRVVIRGLDRNTTILDGEFKRDNGVKVVAAAGVAVENLTARGYTDNGFFWSGVRGYRGSYLTAYRNGDYGIYAFDSTDGRFDHSYASGSPDSGFYIGQCFPCNAVIDHVTSEGNELGYSGTNAGGNLFIVSSTWRHNRAGIVPNTLDSEANPPQREATIAGNLVAGNGNGDAPKSKEDAFDTVFGSGIVIVGGVGDVVTRNRVVDHRSVGIGIVPNPGIEKNVWPSRGNRVIDNVVERSGLDDLGIIAPAPDDGNCFSGNVFETSAPAHLEQLEPCQGRGTGDPTAGAFDLARFLGATHPPGKPYRRTPKPPKQPSMPGAKTAPPSAATGVFVGTIDLGTITVPNAAKR
jgi:hypothetical protein